MATSIVILVISAGLLIYWFRYSCVLILKAKTAQDYSSHVIAAKQLRFVEVHGKLDLLNGRPCRLPEMDSLRSALSEDYQALAGDSFASVREGWLERAMVRFDYHVMRAWYFTARTLFPAQAQQALREMTDIMQYLANAIGQRTSCSQV